MKRSYDHYTGGLPSPEYSTMDDELPSADQIAYKKPKPFGFQNDIINSQEIIQVYQPLSHHIEFVKFQTLFNPSKYLVLLFFGVRSCVYLPFLSQFHQFLHEQEDISLIGVSSNVHGNANHTFPVITDNLRLINNCKVMDPLGGGVYPRDVLKIFDLQGVVRGEIDLNMGYGVDEETVRKLVDFVSVLKMES
ncbi:hypothetical protein WICPIJ_000547 [Wickerhamomyces pijperi]|uniref:Thioredoxin domain-containing protein n=1 Tax=Wickerhamomyces pijperi TaxID=599730 RepID=A0A9P8QDA8_WICPI|nr:hypothetical protein WICPIJ_000547 [Wickerhamomyces pijperi]